MLYLTPDAAHAIVAHATSTYPNECVGLLLGNIEGDTKRVTAICPTENRWQGQVALGETDDPTSQRDRFYLDPRDYLKADRAAREQGLDIVGCYHSHPDHPAQPSERDRVGAQGVGGGTQFAFVIQSVQQGTPAELTSWLLLDNGARFEQERLEVGA
ncbi:MAG: M67 family metallopeptidase [Chloroflexaceae bacterium]|nr:M67 family metallopeptidase [Chloroflexaceae bacterium]NJL34714.1 M67 family metallopeptidase [Chloroflexaceae bacterium]NJO04954.1 M67 family metallopeptidase [Chloroflexaceae bacterium]